MVLRNTTLCLAAQTGCINGSSTARLVYPFFGAELRSAILAPQPTDVEWEQSDQQHQMTLPPPACWRRGCEDSGLLPTLIIKTGIRFRS